MAIVSSANILWPLSLFHLTVAYFLLTKPSVIAQQNLVYILGASMDLVSAPKHCRDVKADTESLWLNSELSL